MSAINRGRRTQAAADAVPGLEKAIAHTIAPITVTAIAGIYFSTTSYIKRYT
ncbi:hypothetical protein [Clostridium mucosae]|uniref:hypothetical protein n=1 Tax=Clostridium sp. DSM 100503 TaxID=2963282 RepID=UPI002149C291|nr:hypothetical protein [Clostridium sp. DSM 100503]